MTKPLVPAIESDLVRLRPLEEADLDLTLAWRNQDAIRRWFLTSSVLSFEQHRSWFQMYRARADDFIFMIESKVHGGLPVGQISLYNIDIEQRKAEYGRLMIGNPAAARKGLAKEATHLILKFAFETLNLDKVYLSVLVNNERAIQLYKACGFSVDGQDENVLKMSIRESERPSPA